MTKLSGIFSNISNIQDSSYQILTGLNARFSKYYDNSNPSSFVTSAELLSDKYVQFVGDEISVNKLVIGAEDGKIKIADVEIGNADSFGAANKVALESAVTGYINDQDFAAESDLQTVSGKIPASLSLNLAGNTFELSAVLTKENGEKIVSNVIDLPLEEMVISAAYDKESNNLKLELKNGNILDVPVSDLVEGLVNQEIFESHVTSSCHVTDEERTEWTGKQDKITNINKLDYSLLSGDLDISDKLSGLVEKELLESVSGEIISQIPTDEELSAKFYSVDNPSGFVTGTELSDISGKIIEKIPTDEELSAKFYSIDNPSGFVTSSILDDVSLNPYSLDVVTSSMQLNELSARTFNGKIEDIPVLVLSYFLYDDGNSTNVSAYLPILDTNGTDENKLKTTEVYVKVFNDATGNLNSNIKFIYPDNCIKIGELPEEETYEIGGGMTTKDDHKYYVFTYRYSSKSGYNAYEIAFSHSFTTRSDFI